MTKHKSIANTTPYAFLSRNKGGDFYPFKTTKLAVKHKKCIAGSR